MLPEPYYMSANGAVAIYHSNCLVVMAAMEPESVDSIVTDPPYGLSFMGKDWDHGVPGEAFWREALRVAKPGAWLLAFGGTRTFHRLACAIEDAGWEIRDTIGWLYGSGFPKSHDVSKAIDKAAGAKREVVGTYDSFRPNTHADTKYNGNLHTSGRITAPATDAARQWSGWGTALKPAWEPVIVARKPLIGTVAQNVLTHGTGGLNIDGCRIGTNDDLNGGGYSGGTPKTMFSGLGRLQPNQFKQPLGRWPANIAHDGSEEVLAVFPQTKSGKMMPTRTVAGVNGRSAYGADAAGGFETMETYGDSGSAARFFYCAKASKADRNSGLPGGVVSNHPCVKPESLMRYLVRLVTPPGGIVLDPFMGSASTGKGCAPEGFRFIGIELNDAYCEIAACRCKEAFAAQRLFRQAAQA